MIASTESAPQVSKSRVLSFAAIVFCGVLPALAVVTLFVAAAHEDAVGTDFRQFYDAANAILDRNTPYPQDGSQAIWGGPYPYPPLIAELAAPFTVLSLQTAGLLVMGLLVACAAGTLYVLGIRDWRCYGVALVWPPVLSAVQTGNVTLVFALAAALAWKYRDRGLPSALAVGAMLAVKFFVWPLLVFFAATRRALTAFLAAVFGCALLLTSWAAIGFDGLAEYPSRLRKLERHFGEDSYTAYIVGLDLGLPSAVARLAWLALGAALLLGIVLAARRGHEVQAFILSIAAALALTPIVWLHYFALLVVVVALARPRLGVLWFLPLGMILTPGSGHPAPVETALTLAVAAATIALALWTVSNRDTGRALGGAVEA